MGERYIATEDLFKLLSDVWLDVERKSIRLEVGKMIPPFEGAIRFRDNEKGPGWHSRGWDKIVYDQDDYEPDTSASDG